MRSQGTEQRGGLTRGLTRGDLNVESRVEDASKISAFLMGSPALVNLGPEVPSP
jgi:hypothetical protein